MFESLFVAAGASHSRRCISIIAIIIDFCAEITDLTNALEQPAIFDLVV